MNERVPRTLPALELRNASLKVDLRTKDSQPVELSAEQAHALSAEVFAEAMDIVPKIEPKVAAALCGVSVSMVYRWRSTEHRERPSYSQLLRLGPEFALRMNRIESRRFGHVRRALMNLMDAAGDLAMAVGE